MDPVLALPVGARDHARGRRDAPVAIVMYADAECPYCGQAEPLLRALLEARGDVRLVYRHYPLVDVHPHAYSRARPSGQACAVRRGGRRPLLAGGDRTDGGAARRQRGAGQGRALLPAPFAVEIDVDALQMPPG